MRRSELPASVLANLIELDQQVEYLIRKTADTDQGIAGARARLTGGFHKQAEHEDLTASLQRLVANKPVLERKLHAAQRTLSSCKAWLDGLPEGTALEPVELKADGRDLDEVRARLKASEAELAALQGVPTPSVDIEERIRAYVAEMARPQVSGIGTGERLKIIWPGGGWDSSGPREHRADILPMMAFLHGDAMVAALLAEIERMVNDPLPVAARQECIAELEAEIDTLQRQALALGEDATDLPPDVVLGVKVVRHGAADRGARRDRAA